MKRHQLFFFCILATTISLAGCENKSKNNSKNDSNDPELENYETEPGNGVLKGHAYIDLGLSVKWASCNIGATKPEELGDYFAWGETISKSTYSDGTYSFFNNGQYTLISKYNNSDNKKTLEINDDVARVTWGGSWRMPTYDELCELRDKCTWKWVTQDSLEGYKITATNGQSIFLPTAGNFFNSELVGKGEDGNYWSSTLRDDFMSFAWYLSFYSGYFDVVTTNRADGCSIRPVCE